MQVQKPLFLIVRAIVLENLVADFVAFIMKQKNFVELEAITILVHLQYKIQ